jgi:histone acetyltransferase (RNA polymerase elongator complex component)
VREAVETAIDSIKENTIETEIAFFGGSFTAVDREYMISLLAAAAPYIGRFKGIRISTRPDAIDEEILGILKEYHVTAIELGAQSMDDEVLAMNERGHTSDDVRRAARMIRERGFELGLQMMTGLYGSTDALDLSTAQEFVKLRPATVRIYPTIVMQGTRLGELYEAGAYRPQELDEAVALCSELMQVFLRHGIKVIRVGLHDTPTLKRELLAGPYHPAFRELCESRIMLDRLTELLQDRPEGLYRVAVNPRSRSKLAGQKKANLNALSERGITLQITGDESLDPLEVVLVE